MSEIKYWTAKAQQNPILKIRFFCLWPDSHKINKNEIKYSVQFIHKVKLKRGFFLSFILNNWSGRKMLKIAENLQSLIVQYLNKLLLIRFV